MREEEFREYLAGRRLPSDKIDLAIMSVKDLEKFLIENGADLASADVLLLKRYISLLIKDGRNSEDGLVSIARYCAFTKRNELFIYIAGVVNAIEVLPGIGDRIRDIEGEVMRSKVFKGIELPQVGSPQEDYPALTQMIIQRMGEELPPERCREVLTWNYHGIPKEAFIDHRDRFEGAPSIDEYLEGEHSRFIDEITRFMKEGKVWYEQEITPETVELVRSNQELSIGRRIGHRIYVTKIPFDPKRYLEENDPVMKRFYACHCPLARTSIRDGGPKVPSTFCYCSAGFTKLPFEVIFGEPVEIELLESVLDGDMRCRFAIKIPEGKMK